ncbi:MAG: hypothetical protein ABI893_04150 [Polaromonas sp.]|uniref:hypothetical protein n=1 Tax=Polaromonas sp. TaxID=1869339 RepID=UPI003266F915
MLEALRPKASTSLKELTRLTGSYAPHLLYPSALKETVLLCLARDLRMVERLSFEEGELDAPLAPSLFVVCELLMRPGTKYHANGQFQMTEAGLARAIKVLQGAVEREIVSRIVGVGSGLDEDEFFLTELDSSQRSEGADL